MKNKERQSLMGKVVTVTEIYRVSRTGKNGEKRVWRKEDIHPRSGWVVGFRTLYEGEVCPGGGSIGSYGDYDPPYLKVSDTVPCILVVWWPTMAPQRVPMDSYTLGGKPIYHQEMAKFYKECYEEHPDWYRRDSKGRFIK